MKIAHVTATFLPYHGGTGMVCYHNALQMARRGHDVTVITSNNPPGSYEYPPEIKVERLPIAFRVGNAPLMPALFGNLRGFDLVHLHYPFIFGQEMVWLRSWLGKTRYVITYHQDLILHGTMGKLVEAHHRVLGAAILKRARRLLLTSLDYGNAARIAPLVRQMGNRALDMPNGVDPTQFRPDIDGTDLRTSYKLQPDDQVVLFVGGLDTPHYFKGVDHLIHAAKKLDRPTMKLMIVGDGDLRPHYTAMAQQLGISERVIFCGRVSNEALPSHYALCDLFVLPSTTMGEAFGIVLLEAMASGKPVIASNLPGVRSVVHDGVDGLLAAPSNPDELATKITTLLDNPQRTEMGRRGREKVEAKYAWSKISDRLEEVYRDVIADD